MTTVVIIPAYRPDQTLAVMADQLWQLGYQIIVVDDGSGEQYEPIFNMLKDICIILTHEVNRGKGAAIKTALRYIQDKTDDCGVIGVMDADGQHLATDFRKLAEFSVGHRGTLVLGVRTVGKEMPLKSRLGNQITRNVFRLVSGVKVSDTQTGLRVFGPELIPALLQVEGDRYEYEMNVLMTFARSGIPIAEIPIHTLYRDQENSTSHFRPFRDSVRIYKDILKFTLSSLSSFLLDYVLFLVLMLMLPHTAAYTFFANAAARVVSACWNYEMNCRFVFHTGRKAGTAAGYFALVGFILAMNSLILETLVQVFHISVYPAKLLTECLLFLISWLVQRFVIFRKKERTGRFF